MSKVGYIYKITCKDESVTDCYVGSTKDINKRRTQHKTSCNNPNDKIHDMRLYKFIRHNNGWDNFILKKVKTIHYDDRVDLLTKERYWMERLGATLNTQVPSRTMTDYYKDNRETKLAKQNEYYKHNKETVKEKRKQYYQENKERIQQYKIHDSCTPQN